MDIDIDSVIILKLRTPDQVQTHSLHFDTNVSLMLISCHHSLTQNNEHELTTAKTLLSG